VIVDNRMWMELGAWALVCADGDEEAATAGLHAAMTQIESGSGFTRCTKTRALRIIQDRVEQELAK